MGKLGFTVELQKCIGCRACQMACKDKNHLAPGTCCRRVDQVRWGDRQMHYSGACSHCDRPACVAACPTGAMYLADDGTVQHEDGKCIGCGSCVWSCPYGAVTLDRGLAVKCNACADLRARGEAPACVAACPTHCLSFGPLQRRQGRADFLPDPALTDPSLCLKGGKVL